MFDKLAWQRQHRRVNRNADTYQYERTTPKGFLMRTYQNMWGRVMGIQRRKAHLYEGLSILPRPVFYAWALSADSDFWELWNEWCLTQDQRQVPSIDRKDPTRGYTLDNMRWITHSENSRNTRQWSHQ